MAGLEVLFASAAPAITCTQDALVCFLHWEMVTHGYYGLGVGDQVRHGAGQGGGGNCLLSKLRGPEAWSRAPDFPAFPNAGPGAHDSVGKTCGSEVAHLLQPSPESLTAQLAQHDL